MLAQLVLQAGHFPAGVVGAHHEGAQALLAGVLVGDGNHHGRLTVLAAGDELLGAVDDVFVAFLHRGGADGGSIGAHVRLGQAEGAEDVAAGSGHQPLLLLRLVAVLHQDGVVGAVGHGDGRAGAAVTGRDFFQHQGQRDIVQTGAAVFFRHANAISTQLGQALVRFLGEAVLLVPLGGVRPQLFLGKGAYRFADHLLVLCQ